MKKVLSSVIFLICGITSFGQTAEENVVRRFGGNLRDWCLTKNINYRKSAQNQCVDACRVVDKIMEDYARSNGVRIKDYVIPNYLNCFQEALGKGPVNFNAIDVKVIHSDEQAYSSSGKTTIEQERKRSKEVVTIACDIIINGVLNYNIKDVYYVRKGQILKIEPYEEIIDQRTGKKKVKVDFSDLVDYLDDDFSGFRYGYSKLTPFNLSLIERYESKWVGYTLQIGGLGGLIDSPIKKTDGDIVTSSRTHFYIVGGPTFSLPFFTAAFGVGGTIFRKTISELSTYNNYSIKNTYVRFMMKPSVSVDIPLFRNSIIVSPYAGYNIILGQKDLNTIEFGIGVLINQD